MRTLNQNLHVLQSSVDSNDLCWARKNMQFETVKQAEIINSKKRGFVQNHTFYAKKERFSAESKKFCTKVNLSGKI